MDNKVLEQLKRIKKASEVMRLADNEKKNNFLNFLATDLLCHEAEILAANQKDLAESAGLSTPLVKRLTLTKESILSMGQGLQQIALSPDPVGVVEKEWQAENGMRVIREKISIGVILFIYESRPNVIIDAAGLCVKSGNCLIVRGGKEAKNSNEVLGSLVKSALQKAGLPESAVEELVDHSREVLQETVKQNKYIDLVVPRGREELIKMIKENATMPVIAHERGLCHMYIDNSAKEETAIALAVNAKTSNPATCNTIEKIILHRQSFEKFGKKLIFALLEKNVEIRGDEAVCVANEKCLSATVEDWDTEYLGLTVTMKVVDSLTEAIQHINLHSSHLTDSIVTEDKNNAELFLKSINSAVVLHNASNRLVDGGIFGLGAELGISTSSIHMKGPMGVNDLTVARYRVVGSGQIRE